MKKYEVSLSLFALLTVLAGIIGFLISVPTGVFALALGLAFSLLHFLSTTLRRARIAQLSETIDKVLHGQQVASIEEQQEGELFVLASEISKMAQRLQEQADLLQRDKLRLTDAIADIFHQMRTPLTSMNLLVSMLTEEPISYEQRLHLARELKKQLERTQWLVEALLKMSKIDAGTALFHSEPVSVRELAEKACRPLRIPMELRGQELVISVGEETYLGDSDWTAEALTNLVKNAMEHTSSGGQVRIDALETALYTQICVEDTGEGFAPEDIPHLFERFYKGKNASDSSIGIGLALSRMIITRQNGTITAENGAQGARFIIKFYKSVV